MFCVVLSQERRVTLSWDKCLDQKFILLTKFTKIDVRQYFAFVEDRDDTQANCRFSCDLTAAMLVYRTIVFWDFDSISMQNLSDILPLFCTPMWPSHHVSENQE